MQISSGARDNNGGCAKRLGHLKRQRNMTSLLLVIAFFCFFTSIARDNDTSVEDAQGIKHQLGLSNAIPRKEQIKMRPPAEAAEMNKTKMTPREFRKRDNAGKDRKNWRFSKSMEFKVEPESKEEKLIISGDFTLVEIIAPATGLTPSLPTTEEKPSSSVGYSGVVAKFCKVNWDAYKKDVPTHSMFSFLSSQEVSKDCETKYTVDLNMIVDKARAFDQTSKGQAEVSVMKPKGFVFHESRCGSTLVANSLAAFTPGKTRVYSESSPPIRAMKACDNARCDEAKHIKLIRDVLYLMGRSSNMNETNLFFKFQSIGTKRISTLRKAFPDTPWIFVYRDPVQVMMSHAKNYDPGKYLRANCNRTFKMQPSDTKKVIHKITGDVSYQVSSIEFCAAHLATLCQYAFREHKSSGTGRMIDYSTLPDILIDEIIPNYFLSPASTFGEKEIQNIREVNGVYSKGFGRAEKKWESDSEQKNKMAHPDIKAAAAKFLQPSFDAIQSHDKV